MPKHPVVSGEKLIKVLVKIGYEIVRQKGSHIRLYKSTEMGEHKITIPKHPEIARGTLTDILSKVSLWNNISKAALIDMIKKM